MFITVSVSDLRNNISSYLDKVIKGARVIIRDDKRGVNIAEIIQTSVFDKNTYEKVLRKAAGTFSSQNHPEWENEQKIVKWVRNSRLSDERSF